MNKLTLVVLAAGLGSRYGGLKQMEPLGPNGEILLDYSLYDAVRAGFSSVVFIIKDEMFHDFHEIIGRRAEKLVDVDYAMQRQEECLPDWFEYPSERGQKPWGTAHAILSAGDKVHSPFVVINSDDFYGAESYKILAEYLNENYGEPSRFAMSGYVLKNTLSKNGFVSRGVCTEDKDGYLASVTERLRIGSYDGQIKYEENGNLFPVAPETIVSMNIWALTERIFPSLLDEREKFFRNINNPAKDEFLLPTAIDGIIKSGQATVKMLKTTAQWYGITYREDKEPVRQALKQMHEQGIYPTLVR